MSVELIQQLVAAGDETVQVCGGVVSAVIDGVRTRLGGPHGDENTFSLTKAGRAVLDGTPDTPAEEAPAEPKVEDLDL